jgi:hypothetical protein
MRTLLILVLVATLSPQVVLAINKCSGPDGRVTYTDEACPANSKTRDRLVEMPPPTPKDAQRARDEAARLQADLRRADEAREAAYAQQRRAERDAAREREREEWLELERRKVEALEAQARGAEVPVIVIRERPAHRPRLPPDVAQSQPREPRPPRARLDGPKLSPR